MIFDKELKSIRAIMEHSNITTAFEITGHKITTNYGIVKGIVVRSRSIFGTLGAVFQMMRGGNISLYTGLCEQTRQDAYNLMMSHAESLGANAVIGVRYESTEIMSGVTEVLCYGTAVTIEITKPIVFGINSLNYENN